MKSFFKENGYSMVKLFLNQIAITVFALMLSMATFSNRKTMLFVSIFSVLFFLYLNYSVCWELGAKDKLRIDAGRMPSSPAKGLLISLGANIPNFICATLIGIGAMIDTKFGQSMSMICDIIARFLNNMYFGVMNFLEYTLYRNTPVSKAVELLRGTAEGAPEITKALELIDNPNYTILNIRDAMTAIDNSGVSSPAVTEALELLDSAAYSPQIIENFWWFFVIIIPSLLVGLLAYNLGTKNFRILSIFGIKPVDRAKNKK